MHLNLFVTRSEYDALVHREPAFMRWNYPMLERHWTVGGVKVRGPRHLVRTLQRMRDAAADAIEAARRRDEASDRWDGQT